MRNFNKHDVISILRKTIYFLRVLLSLDKFPQKRSHF